MNFVIMLSLLVGSAFATAFSASDSNSVGVSFGGATLANTDTKLIVLGRGAYGFAEADADAEVFIPRFGFASQSDASSDSVGSVYYNGQVAIQSDTDTEAYGLDAVANANANELGADVNKFGRLFSVGKSESESLSQAQNKVANTTTNVDVITKGEKAYVDTDADADAEATLFRGGKPKGRNGKPEGGKTNGGNGKPKGGKPNGAQQVVVSESDSDSEGTAEVFYGQAITDTYTDADTEGIFAFADADASAIANATPIKDKLSSLFL